MNQHVLWACVAPAILNKAFVILLSGVSCTCMGPPPSLPQHTYASTHVRAHTHISRGDGLQADLCA